LLGPSFAGIWRCGAGLTDCRERESEKERKRERERDLIRGENKKCSTWRKERLDEQEEKS
jgi:hypothetical protein